MIALDTNLLVRYLVDDDPQQSRQAARLIEQAVARDESLFISDIVACETVGVLASAYGLPLAEIADALARFARGLLSSPPPIGSHPLWRRTAVGKGTSRTISFASRHTPTVPTRWRPLIRPS
jgi:predicted nucleic acid-binding protein